MDLKGTKTEKNIIEAFIQETQSAMTYDYAAYRADVEGHNEITTKLRSSAAIRRGHAMGNMQLLQKDPVTGLRTNITRLNLQSAIEKPPGSITMSIPKWLKPPVKKIWKISPTGSRRWPKPKEWKPNYTRKR